MGTIHMLNRTAYDLKEIKKKKKKKKKRKNKNPKKQTNKHRQVPSLHTKLNLWQ